MRCGRAILLGASFFAQPLWAQAPAPPPEVYVYQYSDAEGNQHFVDDPGLAPPGVTLTRRAMPRRPPGQMPAAKAAGWRERIRDALGWDDDAPAAPAPRADAAPAASDRPNPYSYPTSASSPREALGAVTAGGSGGAGLRLSGNGGGTAGTSTPDMAGGQAPSLTELLERLRQGGPKLPAKSIAIALFMSGLVFALLATLFVAFLSWVAWRWSKALPLLKRWAWRVGAVGAIAATAGLSLPPTLHAFVVLLDGMAAISAERDAARDHPPWWQKHGAPSAPR